MRDVKKITKTADEYRAEAEAHALAFKKQWKTFFQTGIFVMAAFAALMFLSAAWFVNNSRTDVGQISIIADNTSFQLRSYGKKSVYDDDILEDFFKSVTVMEGSSTADSALPFSTTSGQTSTINWLMSDESNLNNYSTDPVDFSETDRKDYAIEPGSEGHLTFSIIPGSDGTQTFQMQLSVLPYSADIETENGTVTQVTEVGLDGADQLEQYARTFLSGHILCFLETEAETETALATETTTETETKSEAESGTNYTWIKDETFEITIEDAVAGQEYSYTIYWKWPQVFAEIILNDKDPYLNGRKPMLTDDLRDLILEDVKENPQKYFYNSLTKQPLEHTDTLISGKQGVADIHEKSPNAGGTDGYYAQNFVDLSSFYNQADQIIGNYISFIFVELTAESGGEEP